MSSSMEVLIGPAEHRTRRLQVNDMAQGDVLTDCVIIVRNTGTTPLKFYIACPCSPILGQNQAGTFDVPAGGRHLFRLEDLLPKKVFTGCGKPTVATLHDVADADNEWHISLS